MNESLNTYDIGKGEDHPIAQGLDSIFKASMKIIELDMKMAPYAIFAIVFNTAYKMGAGFLADGRLMLNRSATEYCAVLVGGANKPSCLQ